MTTISIITICYNNLDELIRTCNSVDEQRVNPYEHIIIDGSTNNEIRKFLEANTQPVYRIWTCEPDDGISDAFNKGIKKSNGEFIVMLNAGDIFYDEQALQKVTKTLSSDSSIKWVHGKYEIKRANNWVIIGKPFKPSKMYRGMRSLCHQSMFVKKSLHDKYGLYSTDYKIAMDYDFVLRIAFENCAFIDYPLVKFEPNGISSKQYLASLREAKIAYEKFYGFSIYLVLWQFRLKILYYLIETKFGKWLYLLKKIIGMENF